MSGDDKLRVNRRCVGRRASLCTRVGRRTWKKVGKLLKGRLKSRHVCFTCREYSSERHAYNADGPMHWARARERERCGGGRRRERERERRKSEVVRSFYFYKLVKSGGRLLTIGEINGYRLWFIEGNK